MTIPLNDYCSTCQEACHDHRSICTVCGTSLEAPPISNSNTTSSSSSSLPRVDAFRLVPEFLTEEVRQASRDLRDILSQPSRGLNNLNSSEWENIPEALLQPQQGETTSKPTSKVYLEKLPRFALDEKSSITRQASLKVTSDNNSQTKDVLKFKMIPGEFGPTNSNETHISESNLIFAAPKTGKDGLSTKTKQEIRQANGNSIVYMERGDGVTFVKKAIMAQEVGATAVVIGNNMSDPWPYIMKDSKGESATLNLRIPVAMIKKEDGRRLVDICQENPKSVFCTFRCKQLSRDCAICCETLNIPQKILKIPSCGHFFHESCALVWLTKHNTCPYCRYELPIDDKEGRPVFSSNNNQSASSEWNHYYR